MGGVLVLIVGALMAFTDNDLTEGWGDRAPVARAIILASAVALACLIWIHDEVQGCHRELRNQREDRRRGL